METSAIYSQLSQIYEQHDPDHRLVKQMHEDERQLSSDYGRNHDVRTTPNDSVHLTSDGDLSITWFDGVLRNRIDLPADLCDEPDRECITVHRTQCLDAIREIETEMRSRKAKYSDDDPTIVDSSYKSVGSEVEECMLLLNKLTEKIKKIELDKGIEKKTEYSKEIDENLKIFASNVMKIEQFIIAMRKFSELQKLHESLPDTTIYDSALVQGIEQLAYRVQRVAYMAKHDSV